MAITTVPEWMENLEEEDLVFIKKFVLYSGSPRATRSLIRPYASGWTN